MLFRPLAKLHVTGFVVVGSPHVLKSCLFVFIVVFHSVPFLLLIRTILRHDVIIMTDWALIKKNFNLRIYIFYRTKYDASAVSSLSS